MPTPSDFDRLCVVLVSTRNPLNIGAAARAMSNLGFLRLRVVNPYEASFREARSAVGAAPLLAKAEQYSSVAEAVADCSLVVGTTAVGKRELNHPLRLLKDAAPVIRKRLRSRRPRCAFVWIGKARACQMTISAIATGSCIFPRVKSIHR